MTKEDTNTNPTPASRENTAPTRPIPHFTSVEEEAEFWDSHSLAEYWDQFTPGTARFAKHLSQGITVRLDPDTLHQLREVAKKKGLGPTTLARLWILERLQTPH